MQDFINLSHIQSFQSSYLRKIFIVVWCFVLFKMGLGELVNSPGLRRHLRHFPQSMMKLLILLEAITVIGCAGTIRFKGNSGSPAPRESFVVLSPEYAAEQETYEKIHNDCVKMAGYFADYCAERDDFSKDSSKWRTVWWEAYRKNVAVWGETCDIGEKDGYITNAEYDEALERRIK